MIRDANTKTAVGPEGTEVKQDSHLTTSETRPDVLLWLNHEQDFRCVALDGISPQERFRLVQRYILDITAIFNYVDFLSDKAMTGLHAASTALVQELAGPGVLAFLSADDQRLERLLASEQEPDAHLLEDW